MSPTSAADPQRAKHQRRLHPPQEDPKEWLPLWAAGPVLALLVMGGLIALVMVIAEVYNRLGRWLS